MYKRRLSRRGRQSRIVCKRILNKGIILSITRGVKDLLFLQSSCVHPNVYTRNFGAETFVYTLCLSSVLKCSYILDCGAVALVFEPASISVTVFL